MLEVERAVVLVVVLARLEVLALELFVPDMPVDVIDVLVLLVEVLDIEVLLLEQNCWRSWRWSKM